MYIDLSKEDMKRLIQSFTFQTLHDFLSIKYKIGVPTYTEKIRL